MNEVYTSLGTVFALVFCATALLLLLGVNFLPNWTKSRGFLIFACGVVVLGSGSIG